MFGEIHFGGIYWGLISYAFWPMAPALNWTGSILKMITHRELPVAFAES